MAELIKSTNMNYDHCIKCGLPQWTVGSNNTIAIDNHGKCNLCNEFDESQYQKIDYESNRKAFENHIESVRNKNKYDGIIMFTGGKDSSYTLYLLKEIYKLNVLAVTWDNGFFSEVHRKNISTVTKNLNVDHRYISIDWDTLKQIYNNRLRNYGRFCNCIPLAFLFLAPIMEETGAPMVFLSISTGQTINAVSKLLTPKKSESNYSKLFEEGILSRSIAPISILAQEMYDILCADLLVGSYTKAALAQMKLYFSSLKRLKNNKEISSLTPSCFFHWDEQKIISTLKEIGWKLPNGKGEFSHTSCMAEEIKAYLSFKQNQINLDVLEYAFLLRTKNMTFEEYETELKNSGYCDKSPSHLDEFLKKLEMERDEFNEIIKQKVAIRKTLPLVNMETAEYLEVDDLDNIALKMQNIYATRILI